MEERRGEKAGGQNDDNEGRGRGGVEKKVKGRQWGEGGCESGAAKRKQDSVERHRRKSKRHGEIRRYWTCGESESREMEKTRQKRPMKVVRIASNPKRNKAKQTS